MEGVAGSSKGLSLEWEKREAQRYLVPHPLSEESFEEFWQNDQAQRGRWEEQAKALERRLKELLELLKRVGCIYRPVYARPKSFTSMVNKAYEDSPGQKLEWNSVMQLGDIVGARVAGLNVTDVIRIVRRILTAQDFDWSRSEIKNFYERAKESGYRSWQVQLDWHPDKRKYPVDGRRVEIQVRTILDDAWAEWDHQVLYKRPDGVANARWDEWKRARRLEGTGLAEATQSVSDRMDGIRQEFNAVYLLPVPDHITKHLDTFRGKGKPSSKVLNRLKKLPFWAEVLGGNFSTGLARSDVRVDWDPRWFDGLEIDDESYSPERRQRFTFAELAETGKGLRLKLDAGDVELYLTEKGFSGKARALLLNCYDMKKTTAHRTFFNEYEGRLRQHRFSGSDQFQAESLRVEIGKTNFAYEVCTTYMLEQKRTLVRDKNGAEHKDLAKMKEPLRKILLQEPFGPYPFKAAANPIGVHVNLISISGGAKSKPELIVMRRGRESALHQHQWSTAVSGVMAPIHESIESGGDIPGLFTDDLDPKGFPDDVDPKGCRNKDHKPCLFRSAQRELEEEIAVHVPVDHIKVIALMRDGETGQPILVVEAYTEKQYDEIEAVRGVAEEAWEVDRLLSLPLDEVGLRRLFSGHFVIHRPKSNERAIYLPKPLRTSLNGTKGEEVWQPRSAAAVVLTLCRYFGSRPLGKYLTS